jgi:hypothetical protein
MKNSLFVGLVLLAAGCAAPTRTIKFDSDPQGAHVFMTMGANEDMAKNGRDYLGVTPFTWTTEVNGDGSFKTDRSAIPFYSSFVQSVVVFTAEPPSGATNLYTKREVFHGNADYQKGNNAPQGVFFDLTKPN